MSEMPGGGQEARDDRPVAAVAEITPAMIASAERIAGVDFGEAARPMMVDAVVQQKQRLEELRAIRIPHTVAPTVVFTPLLAGGRSQPRSKTRGGKKRRMVRSRVRRRSHPAREEELALLPVTELSALIRRRQVTSVELAELYLARLKRNDSVLRCVVTLMEERALAQARAADDEITHGRYRGPLHGIPWGAKDLVAVAGAPTTWGTPPYRAQVIDEDATIVQRLDAAGAVLLGKLSLGELAMGDVWFGGMTRNPWKTDQGSSGSSAGSASATAAGLVGFSIGSETLGSLAYPAARCGVTALRPTFGRVPRTGAMALSWTMDKLGPICRSVEDCALVLDAIHGGDGRDASALDAPFDWDARVKPASLRIGYVKSAFELADETEHATRRFDDQALEVLRTLGVEPIPVEIPDFPYGAMAIVLAAEGAAAFDELTRSGRVREMIQQDAGSRPNGFRVARFIPAADYVNAQRARALAMEKWAELMSTVDVIVAPTFGPQVTATNLTGHPAVILPNGFAEDGTPVSITFLGGLFEEAKLLAVAHAYQQATDFHLKHPPLGVEGAKP